MNIRVDVLNCVFFSSQVSTVDSSAKGTPLFDSLLIRGSPEN